MKKIEVKTGFGYFKDKQGHIVSKYQLPLGEHKLADDLDYIEVGSQAELDQIEVWRDPSLIEKSDNEKKIVLKYRDIAIKELKAKGELPADFIDPMTAILVLGV